MDDDSKLPPTSSVVLINPLSTLSFIGKHNMCSLTVVSKFLDMVIDIVQCPITFYTIEELVYVAGGRLYDRKLILHWISGNGRSPKTREQLTSKDIRPDLTTKKIIEVIKESKIERDHLEELKQVLVYLGK